MTPKSLDHLQARFQAQLNNLVLGVNGLAKDADIHNSEGAIYGLDLRYTIPHFIFRGELVRADSPLSHSDGYYVDGTYRLPGLTRTELGFRNEAFGFRGTGKRSMIDTGGIRQIISPAVSCNLNYAWGAASTPTDSLRKGWSFQVVYYLRF